MKNIQVIDVATNSTYDVYRIPDKIFVVIFPNDTDIAFVSEVEKRLRDAGLDDTVWSTIFGTRIDKKRVYGIHGTLHLAGSAVSKWNFPTRKESDAMKNRTTPVHRPPRLKEKV